MLAAGVEATSGLRRIREWMAGHGLPANSPRDYFDEEVYAWRQDTSSGNECSNSTEMRSSHRTAGR